MRCLVNLDFRDASPIYEQIKKSFSGMVLSGALKEDEKLPSVRELAVELAINPNTIQRAYRELEHEGVIYSVPGKGSFVSGDNGMKQRRIDECFEKISAAMRELNGLGVEKGKIIDFITQRGEGNDRG